MKRFSRLGRALLLSLTLMLAACGGKGKAAAAATPAPAQVQTAAASEGTITPSLQIAGVVAPYRQFAVTANLTEPIAEVDVVEGQAVHAGQVLARLTTDDLEAQLASSERIVREDAARYAQTAYQAPATTAQNSSGVSSAAASLHQAQVNLAGAQNDLRRYQQLGSSGYIPVQTIDQQRVVVASDQQAVDAAQAALQSAGINNRAAGNGLDPGVQRQELDAARAAVDSAQATVDQLKLEIARAVVTAPVDGVIDSVNANPGEYPTGRQLFTLEQNAKVYALLQASTAQVVNIRRGAAASVVLSTSSNANPAMHKDAGVVDAVLDQIEPGTTNFTVKVLIDNADGHLHAGMPVNGFVDLPPVSGLVVPVTAFTDDTHAAMDAVDGGVVHQKAVVEVADDGANAVVTGLGRDERVIKNVSAVTVGNGDQVVIATPAPEKRAAR